MVWLLEQGLPKVKQRLYAFALARKDRVEPARSIQLRRHISLTKYRVHLGVMVLHEQPEEAEARLNAVEVLVTLEQRRHEDVDEEAGGVRSERERITQQLLKVLLRKLIFLVVEADLSHGRPGVSLETSQAGSFIRVRLDEAERVSDGKPQERTKYFVVALPVRCATLPGQISEHLLDVAGNIFRRWQRCASRHTLVVKRARALHLRRVRHQLVPVATAVVER